MNPWWQELFDERYLEFYDRGLDLGSGVGRHAVPLARRHEVELTLLRRDMRQLDDLEPFDACLCLYTVFGYFDDDENEVLLRTIRSRLVGGGWLVLDVTNPLALMASWPV